MKTPPLLIALACVLACLSAVQAAVLTSVQIREITHRTVRVQYFTDVPAKGYMEYGQTPAYGFRTTESGGLLNSHIINLTGLKPSTLYHYRVVMTDGSNVVFYSGDQTVQTTAGSLTPALPIPPRPVDPVGTSNSGRILMVHDTNCNDGATGLQARLNQAQPGDTVKIPAGLVCRGQYIPPAKSGTDWITVRTATPDEEFAKPGQRVTPALLSKMPVLQTPNLDQAALYIDSGHHYRFIGLAFTGSSPGENGTMVHSTHRSHHLSFERILMHTVSPMYMKWNFGVNGEHQTIRDSYIESVYPGYAAIPGMRWSGGTKCWDSYQLTGPAQFINNFCGSVGIGIFFNDDSASTDDRFGDVLISQNLFAWNERYRKGSPESDGIFYEHRGVLEFKKGRRIRFEGNIIENVWGEQLRQGQMFIITPRNGPANVAQSDNMSVSDLDIVSNIFRNGAGFFQADGQNLDGGGGRPLNVPLTRRIAIRNNLIYDINGWTRVPQGAYYSSFHSPFVAAAGGFEDLTVENNTVVDSKGDGPSILRIGGDAIGGLRVRNNIFWLNTYATGGGVNYTEPVYLPTGEPKGSFVGKALLDRVAVAVPDPSYEFQNNAIVVGQTGYGTSTANQQPLYPPGNFWPGDGNAGFNAIGFVNKDQKNFRLGSGSPYRNAGTNGRDIGVDMDVLEAALAGNGNSPSSRASAIGEPLQIVVYPNPWRIDRSAPNMSFEGFSTGGTVKIFTVSGHLVREIHTETPKAIWDVRNRSGDRVASGIYLWVAEEKDGRQARGKLAIIR